MLEGWGDISVSKVFTTQAWGPESDLQHLCEKPGPPRKVCLLGIHFWNDIRVSSLCLFLSPWCSLPGQWIFFWKAKDVLPLWTLCIERGRIFFWLLSLQGVPHGYSDLYSGEMFSLVFGGTFHLLLFETWVWAHLSFQFSGVAWCWNSCVSGHLFRDWIPGKTCQSAWRVVLQGPGALHSGHRALFSPCPHCS